MKSSRFPALVAVSVTIIFSLTACAEWENYVNEHSTYVASTAYVQNSRSQNTSHVFASEAPTRFPSKTTAAKSPKDEASLASTASSVKATKTNSSEPESKSQEVASKRVVECLRWLNPHAETMWEEIIQASERLSLQPRMENVDDTQAEGQLEAFGTRYMPNTYAQYQQVRAKALELEQMVKETFPQGAASDPTGGTMFAKANKNLALAVARTFRRRDELCFFLLFHQAGIFSENVLAKYDSRPIVIYLEPELPDWPDDTPKADTALTTEDATFAAKYFPETHTGYQRLCNLFNEGAKQYADLRRTALALGASRARKELNMLKTRLEEIQAALQQYKKDISAQRLEHVFGEATAENLALRDHTSALQIQEYERKMGVKAYVARAAKGSFLALPGGAVMEMVWCPPGTFMMGSPANEEWRHYNETLHQVTLTKGFWMAKTEVTQAQWQSVMGNNPSAHKGDDLPVERVSWNACQKFCQKAGLSLPTEAEWEYACRAGSTEQFGGTGNLEDMGWYSVNSQYTTHPVGQKQPNAWGLYDMHGNVYEWCQDWLRGDYPSGAVTNPTGADNSGERVRRGGSYTTSASDYRSANRKADEPHLSYDYYGFRPVFRQD